MSRDNPNIDQEKLDFLKLLGLDPDAPYEAQVSVDISAMPKEQWESYTAVTPPAAILRYLESGDKLSNHTIDMMEIAIETAYGIHPPWYIDSIPAGSEAAGDLKVEQFILMREK